MSAKYIEFTPVVARRSRIVHAVPLTLKPCKTACGKAFERGWRIALDKVNCKDCKLKIGLSCKRAARGRK